MTMAATVAMGEDFISDDSGGSSSGSRSDGSISGHKLAKSNVQFNNKNKAITKKQ